MEDMDAFIQTLKIRNYPFESWPVKRNISKRIRVAESARIFTFRMSDGHVARRLNDDY